MLDEYLRLSRYSFTSMGGGQGLGLELSQWLTPAPSLVTLEAPHCKGFPQ